MIQLDNFNKEERYSKIPEIIEHIFELFRNTDKSLEDYNKIIESEPYNAETYLLRGHCYLSLNEYEKALDDYSKYIDLNPENPFCYLARVTLYIHLEQYENALNDFIKFIELNTESDTELDVGYLLIAYCYNRIGKIDEEQEYFNKFIDIINEMELKELNKAIKNTPENPDEYLRRGSYYHIKIFEFEKALKDFNKAIELDPENSLSYYARGCLYLSRLEYYKAFLDFSKAIEIDPENEMLNFAYTIRGVGNFFNQKYDESLNDINKAIELDSENNFLYLHRAIYHLLMQNYDECLNDCNKVIEYHPGNEIAYIVRSVCQLFLKNYDESLKDCDKVKQINSQTILINWIYLINYAMQENVTGALNYIKHNLISIFNYNINSKNQSIININACIYKLCSPHNLEITYYNNMIFTSSSQYKEHVNTNYIFESIKSYLNNRIETNPNNCFFILLGVYFILRLGIIWKQKEILTELLQHIQIFIFFIG